MTNLLPDQVAEKKAPSFYYYSYQPYVDFEQLTKLDNPYQSPVKEDPVTNYRRVINQQARKSKVLNMMGQQLRLTVDDQTIYVDNDRISNPIRFQPYSLQKAALFDRGCITCGGPNISVRYHADRHVCLKCRDMITTLNGDQVLIFQDDDGQVCVVGITDSEGHNRKLYFVEMDELRIKGYRCYVTFSSESELIVLLHDGLNDHKKQRIPISALQQGYVVEQSLSRSISFVEKNKRIPKKKK